MFDILVDLVKEVNHVPSGEVKVTLQTPMQYEAECQAKLGNLKAKAMVQYMNETDNNKKRYMFGLMCNGVYNFENLKA